MLISEASLSERLDALAARARDEFSRWAIEGARRTLADGQNPLRLNFFSTGMRILFEHMMDMMSPEDQVLKVSWFKSEREGGKPSRGQRVTFASQGGLSDDFVKDDLKVDVPPLRKRLLAAVDDLSKHVHGRENTIVTELSKQKKVIEEIVSTMEAFQNALDECRAAVINPITEKLDNAAVDALLSEALLELDDLASHHSLDEIYPNDVEVAAIEAETITYLVTGTPKIGVSPPGAESSLSFPFRCEIVVPLEDPLDLDSAEASAHVDTSAYRKALLPDE